MWLLALVTLWPTPGGELLAATQRFADQPAAFPLLAAASGGVTPVSRTGNAAPGELPGSSPADSAGGASYRWWLLGLVVGGLLALLLYQTFYLRRLCRQWARLTRDLEAHTRDLEERGGQFQALFDNAAVSVMVHDPDSGEVLQANARALESYGVESVEQLNRAAFDDHTIWAEPPYSLADLACRFAQVRELGPQRFEWLTRSLDGSEIWEDVFLQLMRVSDKPRLVSTAIDVSARKQAQAGLQRQLRLEEQVREVSLSLLTGHSGENGGILHALERIGRFMQTRRCILFDYDTESGGMCLRDQWCAPGVEKRQPDLYLPGVAVRPYTDMLLRGEPVAVCPTDDQLLEYTLLAAGGSQSFLALPILREGNLMGILMLSFSDRQQHWPPTDLKLLQVAADLIGGALVRQCLARELERQASHDGLTGLYNRRKFENLLLHELGRADRYHRAAAVILLDVDHFKAVNDRYGHDVGDEVLCQLSAILHEQIRDSDVAARWGGEEFIILLPETDLDGALHVADALRQHIADTPFPAVGQVTVSLGVSAYQRDETLDSLIKRADDALYQAKAAGRNRVSLAASDKDEVLNVEC